MTVAKIVGFGWLVGSVGGALAWATIKNRTVHVSEVLHEGSSMADVLADQETAAPTPAPSTGSERDVLSLDGYRATRRRAEVIDVDTEDDDITRAARRAIDAAPKIARPVPSAAATAATTLPVASGPGSAPTGERAVVSAPGETYMHGLAP